jgi:hypothetical protein
LRALGTAALARSLEQNTALTALNAASNQIAIDGAGNGDMSGVICLSAAIRDNRALSIANIMGNRIGKEMLSKLQEIMRSKPNRVSLCGIADDATEADLSGLRMDADDAIILTSELPDKGALTSLDLSSNGLGRYVKDNQWVTDKSGISPRMRSALGFLFMRFAQCLRYCRPCQCHLQYGGHIVHQSPQEHHPS